MDLQLDLTERDGVGVLAVAGEVDVATAPRLRQSVLEAAASGRDTLIVDMSEVEFLDSTGLGVLVSGIKRFRTLGGDLLIVATGPRILKVFEITGLTTVFGIYDSVEDALASRE